MKVGVKFCGNCNPHFDMVSLITKLAVQADEITFCRWDDDEADYDVLLVLNSCGAGCATRPSFSGRTVIVTSEAVNCWPVTNEELPAAVLAALKNA